MPPISRPVRPPTFPSAPPALESAFPADEVTLLRPSDALDWSSLAFCLAASAASEVDEALRMPARRTANVECRSTARDAARDIMRDGRGDCRTVVLMDSDGMLNVARFFGALRRSSRRP